MRRRFLIKTTKKWVIQLKNTLFSLLNKELNLEIHKIALVKHEKLGANVSGNLCVLNIRTKKLKDYLNRLIL